MINLAIFRNKYVLAGAIALVIGLIIAIGYTVTSIKDLFNPNNDQQIIQASKARKVITDQVIDTNEKLKTAIEDKTKSNKVDNQVVVAYIKKETKSNNKINSIVNDLTVKQSKIKIKIDKIKDDTISSITDRNETSDCSYVIDAIEMQYDAETKSAEANIDALFGVYNEVSKEVK